MSEAVFQDVNLRRSTFRNVNLAEATIQNANLRNVSIDESEIGGLTIMGFDIQALIKAEMYRRELERLSFQAQELADPADARVS
jgi:uncharacterized protein YjbI with pentapeptide repeats